MRIELAVFSGSVAYATLRYNIFKGVAWSEWPVYVVNKACAVTALLLLVICAIRQCRNQDSTALKLMLSGWMFAGLHVLISLMLLGATYYAKFYQDGKLTIQCGFSLLLGAFAAVTLHFYARTCQSAGLRRRCTQMGVLALVIGLHAMLQGFSGWLEPAKWPGLMPPITLISFLAGITAFTVTICRTRPAA